MDAWVPKLLPPFPVRGFHLRHKSWTRDRSSGPCPISILKCRHFRHLSFVSVHVYMRVYVCLHMCMYVDVHPQGCRGLVITLDIFYFLIYSRPRNKRGTPWFLLIQLALRISCLCLLSIRITGDCHACPDVTWLLEIQTWSLILSHLPRPGRNL